MPEISVANQDAVEQYFLNHPPNMRFMRFFHWAMGHLIHPDMIHEDGAREEHREHIEVGNNVILAISHSSYLDPEVAGSVVEKDPVYHPMRGTLRIPGNAPLFEKPVIGWIVRQAANPIIRDKDMINTEKDILRDQHGKAILTAEQKEAKRRANAKSLGINISWLNQPGHHAAIMPEGTRRESADDGVAKPPIRVPVAGHLKRLYEAVERDFKAPKPTTIKPIHPGIAALAFGVEHPERIGVICLSIDYGDPQTPFHPRVGLSRLVRAEGSQEKFLWVVRNTMQDAMDMAVAAR